MKLQKQIEWMIRNYPALHESRTSALNQLFCVIGNGYDWIDGELKYYDEKERSEDVAIRKQSSLRGPSSDEFVLARAGRLKLIRDEYVIRATAEFPRPKFAHWYPMCKYSGMYNFPSNIRSDWANGIRETAAKVLNTSYDEWIASYSNPNITSKAQYRRNIAIADRAIRILG